MDYAPALNYEISFNETTGNKAWIKMNYEVTLSNCQLRSATKKKEIPMFDSNYPEELIYTIYKFKLAAKDMDMHGDEKAAAFAQILCPSPQKQWDAVQVEFKVTAGHPYPRSTIGKRTQRIFFLQNILRIPTQREHRWMQFPAERGRNQHQFKSQTIVIVSYSRCTVLIIYQDEIPVKSAKKISRNTTSKCTQMDGKRNMQ